MSIYELSALGAAMCWALTGIITATPVRHLGPLAFNRLKLTAVSAVLLLYVVPSGSWAGLAPEHVAPLLLSGLVGIFLGDTILYVALNRLGPRRTGVLFATNAPMTAVLGWLVLGERLTAWTVAGIGLVTLGVVLAILFGRRRDQTAHHWEAVNGRLWVGVAIGLLAALAQAVGSILIRPAMQAGVDPVLASLFRVAVAALALNLLAQLPFPAFRPRWPLTRRIAAQTVVSGTLSMAVGMTLLLFALSGGQVGVVSTLSATTPVIILPMLWLVMSQRPAWGAWAGALAVVAGMAMIFA